MKRRIDGRHLGQNIGEQVVLLGTVAMRASNGKNIELHTTDGTRVNVALSEPIEGACEGYVEVHGTAQSKSTMSCSTFMHFPPEMIEKFDPHQYSELMVILNILGDKKWKMSETSVHF